MNNNDISENKKCGTLDRRTFIRSAALLVGGFCIYPALAINNTTFSGDLAVEETDYLCCMQLTYRMAVDAKLRRETSELYGNLDKKEYRDKLTNKYYLPNSKIHLNGKDYYLSSNFAAELVRRSGSADAEKIVTEVLGIATMNTSFSGLGSVSNNFQLQHVDLPAISLEEQNTLVQIMWKMAFNPKLSEAVIKASRISEKEAALRSITTDFGHSLSIPVAKTIAQYLEQNNHMELTEYLSNNIYAASW